MSQQGFGHGFGGTRGFTGNTFPPHNLPPPPPPKQKYRFQVTVDLYFSIDKGKNPDVAEKPLSLIASMIEDIMKKWKMETKDGVIELLGFNKTEIEQIP